MKRNLLSRTLLLLLMVVGGVCGAWAAPGDEIKSPNDVVSGKSYYIKGVSTISKVETEIYYGPTETDKANQKVSSNAVTNIAQAMPVKFIKVTDGWTLQTPNGNYIRPHTSNGQSYFVSEAVVMQLTSGTTKEGKDKGIRIGAYEGYYIQANKQSPKIGAYTATQWDVTLIEASDAVPSAVSFANLTPSIEFPATKTYSQAATAVTGYTGTITYEITTNTAGATLSGTTVTVTQEGKVTIKATAPATEGYLASSATYTLTVTDSRTDCGLEYETSSQNVYVGQVLSAPTLTNPNNLVVTFSSNDETIATVDANGNVTGVAKGSTTITAFFEGNDDYAAGSATYTITVREPLPNGTLIYEGVSGYNGTTDSGTVLIPASNNLDSDEWDSFTKVYPGKVISGDENGHLKFGSSSDPGTATTKAIALKGNGKLTYKVQRYDSSNAGQLNISVTGATASGDVSVSGTAEWVEKTVYLTGGEGEVVITFATTSENKRIRVDDILLVIEDVTIPVTKDYISYASPYALDFSAVEGLEALVVTKINETSVSTEAVTTVPAGEGVILHRTGTATSFNVPVAATATAHAANKLVGVLEATEIGGNGTDYVLKDGKFVLANAGTLAAGKAYLQVKKDANAAPALTIGYGDEGTTGIRSIDNGQLTIDNVYYDLSGRRVAEPTKGVYIVNGKKVVIK